jgi:CBS domain-containing protein
MVRDLMTKNPISLPLATPISEAARKMRDANVGAVIVQENGRVCGIVTDRDITVRAIATDKDPMRTAVAEICSRNLATVSPNDDIKNVIRLMEERAVRRVPVVDNGNVVGILSLGDLAIARARMSALGEISAAPPNR